MAQFTCHSCDYSAHFVEFKTGSHIEESDDEDSDDSVEVDDVECPECGSSSVSED